MSEARPRLADYRNTLLDEGIPESAVETEVEALALALETAEIRGDSYAAVLSDFNYPTTRPQPFPLIKSRPALANQVASLESPQTSSGIQASVGSGLILAGLLDPLFFLAGVVILGTGCIDTSFSPYQATPEPDPGASPTPNADDPNGGVNFDFPDGDCIDLDGVDSDTLQWLIDNPALTAEDMYDSYPDYAGLLTKYGINPQDEIAAVPLCGGLQEWESIHVTLDGNQRLLLVPFDPYDAPYISFIGEGASAPIFNLASGAGFYSLGGITYADARDSHHNIGSFIKATGESTILLAGYQDDASASQMPVVVRDFQTQAGTIYAAGDETGHYPSVTLAGITAQNNLAVCNNPNYQALGGSVVRVDSGAHLEITDTLIGTDGTPYIAGSNRFLNNLTWPKSPDGKTCSLTDSSGAVDARSTLLTVNNTFFSGNGSAHPDTGASTCGLDAVSFGGAIFAHPLYSAYPGPTADVLIDTVTFSQNVACHGAALAIREDAPHLTISNSDFNENVGSWIIDAHITEAVLTNNTFRDNQAIYSVYNNGRVDGWAECGSGVLSLSADTFLHTADNRYQNNIMGATTAVLGACTSPYFAIINLDGPTQSSAQATVVRDIFSENSTISQDGYPVTTYDLSTYNVKIDNILSFDPLSISGASPSCDLYNPTVLLDLAQTPTPFPSSKIKLHNAVLMTTPQSPPVPLNADGTFNFGGASIDHSTIYACTATPSEASGVDNRCIDPQLNDSLEYQNPELDGTGLTRDGDITDPGAYGGEYPFTTPVDPAL